MLANVNNYMKILNTAQSCQTKDHIQLTFHWANKFRSKALLTEFEYLEIEKTLLEIMGLDISLSQWNSTINLDSCFQKTQLK